MMSPKERKEGEGEREKKEEDIYEGRDNYWMDYCKNRKADVAGFGRG